MTTIKHNTDSADGGAVENDPLSGAASGYEAPEFPLLQGDRIYEAKISSCKKKSTKDDATREMLEIVVATTKDNIGTKGENLRSGYKVYTYIGITPIPAIGDKRERTIDQIAKELAMVWKAVGKGTRSPRDLINNPSSVEQEIVNIKVSIQKGKDGYADKNVFKFVLSE